MVLYVYYENGEIKRIDTLKEYLTSRMAISEEAVDAQVARVNAQGRKGKVWKKVVIDSPVLEKVFEFLYGKGSFSETYEIEEGIRSCEKSMEDVSCNLGEISSQLEEVKDLLKELKENSNEEDLF